MVKLETVCVCVCACVRARMWASMCVWMDTKGRMYSEAVWEQGYKESIWTQEGWSNIKK
jgi:hypothetical protein